MKRKLPLVVLGTLMVCTLFAQQNATDLFISEYCEWNHKATDPQVFNHYVELYNGTGSEIDMTKYQLWRAKNGGGWGMDGTTEVGPFALEGTLANGETFVIARPVEDGSEVTADMRWSFLNISGDDAVGLAKDDSSGAFILIDVIGEPDVDPGSAWSVGDSLEGTRNHTLIRKPSIGSPTSDWVASAGTSTEDSQWIVMAENDSTDVKMHTTDFTGTVNVFENQIYRDQVYPVPSNGSFIYKTAREQFITVVDITGRSVKTFRVIPGENSVTLDVPSGLYFITSEKKASPIRMLISK